MERTEEGKYKVISPYQPKKHFYELLDYFYEHYPLDRAEEIANELRSTAKSLEDQPERGAPEIKLPTVNKNTVIYYINVHLGQISKLFTT